MKKFSYLLVIAMLGLGLMAFAGCGDDDESSSGGSTTTETTEESTPEATVESTPEATVGEDTGDTGEVPEGAEAAVEQCKAAVDAAGAQLSEDAKNDVKDLCEKAASGDVQDAQEAAKEVCKRLIEETVPEGTPGDAKEQALQACEDSVPTG